MKMSQEELNKIFELHKKWLKSDSGGEMADLRGADLRGANIEEISSLFNTIGESIFVKSMQIEKYFIVYTNSILQIECEKHTIEEWKNFSDDEISKMDNGALEWWNKWKETIFKIIEMSPAKNTKENA